MHHAVMHRTWVVIVILALAACRSLEPRPAISSYGCMRAVRDQVQQQLPADTRDKRLHCTVSARIARQCSVTEAYLAGLGKEVSDLFTGGDAEWADWQADRAGVRCVNEGTMAGLAQCCAQHGY